ncbi:hypothetical protein E2C01_028418 [Portunus trituberculatus]|uniref:Uncharacterized protein n=1 Tax=Portunus trituberculatus TaxID=210409 RepID=A0A5B7EKK8_PORTR|nr:hypothetical protein [Portunus trituberculatus]
MALSHMPGHFPGGRSHTRACPGRLHTARGALLQSYHVFRYGCNTRGYTHPYMTTTPNDTH